MQHIHDAANNAVKLVTGPRRSSYGDPIDNHSRTALLWTAWARANGHNVEFSPEDVCAMNMLQKMSRAIHGGWAGDTPEDIIGFTLNLVDIEHAQEQSFSRKVTDPFTEMIHPGAA